MVPTAGEVVLREVERFHGDVRTMRVAPTRTAIEIADQLDARYDFARPVPLPHAIADVIELLRSGTLHSAHPRYFGLFNPAVHEAGVWGDTLAALYNPQLGTWGHSPTANGIECHVLRFFARTLGFPDDAVVAQFTSGGSEANHTAILGALAHLVPQVVEEGIGGAPTLAVYASAESHHSFRKIVRSVGLGERALRLIRTDDRFRIDIDALRTQVAADRCAGIRPLAIVATVGTTAAGAIDDLSACAAVADEAGAWFHVDAAWGAAAILSPRLEGQLQGITRADSITWDAHKWLSVPMGAGMLFCRRPEALSRMFRAVPSYVPLCDAPQAEPYLASLQWSRRFIGLKVFLTVAALGAPGLRAMVEHQTSMGELLRTLLIDRGWQVVNDTALPLVCFTPPTTTRGRGMSITELAGAIQSRGVAWISAATLPGNRAVLRACITHFDTGPDDVKALVEELELALGGG